LSGVESMVGLFINTLPVRLRVDLSAPLAELFARLQERQAELTPYQYLGLADVTRLTGLGTLFDTIAVFENYPIDVAGLERSAEHVGEVAAEVRYGAHYLGGPAATP